MSKKEPLTLTEAAKYARVTRQAIYKALRHRGLKAFKKGKYWMLFKEDIDEYRGNKYNRDMRMVNGEYIFDMEKGEFSVMQVCKVISSTLGRPFPLNRIYYLLRTGQLRSFKKGSSWVIKKEDAVKLLQDEMDNDITEVREMTE